jgi:hypothetical protein
VPGIPRLRRGSRTLLDRPGSAFLRRETFRRASPPLESKSCSRRTGTGARRPLGRIWSGIKLKNILIIVLRRDSSIKL